MLTEYEVSLLVSERAQPMHDFEIVEDASQEDLDPDAVARLLRRVRARDPQPFAGLDDITALRRLNVLKETASGLRPTLAGLLTLGAWPQQFFPQLCVTFVAVPGTAKDALPEGLPRFTDNATLRGPLPKIVEDAVGVILRNSRTAGHVQGVGRLDVGSYPVEALREAVTNAVAHRDYSPGSRGTQVQVELYVDRLVVRNPGGLFGTVLLDDLGSQGVSSSRNGLLVDLLGDVYLPGTVRVVVDNRGSGIPDVLARLRQAGMSLPTFDSAPSRFQVAFPAHALLTQETLAWIDGLQQPGLAHPQILALALVKEGRPVSNGTLRQLGLDSRAATNTLADLRRRGLAAKVGGRRYAEYVLEDPLPAGDPEPGLFAELAHDTAARTAPRPT